MRTFKEISQKIGKAEPIDFKTLFEDSVEVFKKFGLFWNCYSRNAFVRLTIIICHNPLDVCVACVRL